MAPPKKNPLPNAITITATVGISPAAAPLLASPRLKAATRNHGKKTPPFPSSRPPISARKPLADSSNTVGLTSRLWTLADRKRWRRGSRSRESHRLTPGVIAWDCAAKTRSVAPRWSLEIMSTTRRKGLRCFEYCCSGL